MLEPLGLRPSESKTQVVHERRVRLPRLPHPVETQEGHEPWHVYTFIADRPIRSVKAKIRALTRRTSQQDPATVLIRLNQSMHGWAQLLQTCSLQTHTQSPVALRVVAGDRVAAQNASLEVEGRPPSVHHTHWAVDTDRGGRDHVVQPGGGAGHPILLPGNTIPRPGPCPTTPTRQEPWRSVRGDDRLGGGSPHIRCGKPPICASERANRKPVGSPRSAV